MRDADTFNRDVRALVEEQAQYERRNIVELVGSLKLHREAARTHGRKADEIAESVKLWLTLNRETEIIDDELGVRAYLQPRKTAPKWDVQSMPDDLILALANAGLLTVSTAAFDALRKAAGSIQLDDANKYRMEGETEALMVEAVKS